MSPEGKDPQEEVYGDTYTPKPQANTLDEKIRFEDIDSIEKDLIATLEGFRQAEGTYQSATPAVSTMAGQQLMQRFLAWNKRSVDQSVRESRIDELEAIRHKDEVDTNKFRPSNNPLSQSITDRLKQLKEKL